jgi:hypothetical protein
MCKDDGDFDAERAYNSLKVCKRSAPLPSSPLLQFVVPFTF